jgi:hypothetical protein
MVEGERRHAFNLHASLGCCPDGGSGGPAAFKQGHLGVSTAKFPWFKAAHLDGTTAPCYLLLQPWPPPSTPGTATVGAVIATYLDNMRGLDSSTHVAMMYSTLCMQGRCACRSSAAAQPSICAACNVFATSGPLLRGVVVLLRGKVLAGLHFATPRVESCGPGRYSRMQLNAPQPARRPGFSAAWNSAPRSSQLVIVWIASGSGRSSCRGAGEVCVCGGGQGGRTARSVCWVAG